MWTKIKFVGLFAFALALSGVAQAEDDKLFADDLIPGTVGVWLGFGSDYNWRGVSQTGDEPSVQAEFDYSVDVTDATSFYISVWGSNVDFGAGDDASVEMDIWGGLTGSLPFAEGLTWDIGMWGYFWPGYNGDIDFYEVYGGLGYDFGLASISGYIYYSPDFIDLGDDSQYYSGDISIPLPKGLSLNFHAIPGSRTTPTGRSASGYRCLLLSTWRSPI
jgi:uncharacterized protein (TIGR02001 family)